MGRAGRVKAHLRRRRDERGAALIEAVIIVPLLLLLTFGAVEFGIGYSQKAGLETLARAGARRASPEQGVDNPGNTQIGDDARDAVNAAVGQTSNPDLKYMYVYRMHFVGTGLPYASSLVSGFGDGKCGGNPDCIEYRFDPATKQFGAAVPGTTWPAIPLTSHRNACATATTNPDRVGVTVMGQFSFLSGLVGSGKVDMTATSILQIEPTACS